jgi:hypothetical protein
LIHRIDLWRTALETLETLDTLETLETLETLDTLDTLDKLEANLILEKFSTLNLNVASLRASSSSSTSQTWSVFAMVFTPIST